MLVSIDVKPNNLTNLCIVAGGHQEVGQHEQLVVRELLFVLLPVVVVGPPEIRQRLFHSHLQGRQSVLFSVTYGFKFRGKINVECNKSIAE